MHFLSFSIFEQLAFALTTEFALNFSRQGADAPPPTRTPMPLLTRPFPLDWLSYMQSMTR